MTYRTLLVCLIFILKFTGGGSAQISAERELIPLEELRATFKKQHLAMARPLGELRELYFQQLSRLRDQAQAEGELAKVVAINAEIRILSGKAPEEQEADFAELARVRLIYEKASTTRSIEVKESQLLLLRSFADQLGQHKVALTKSNEIEKATQIQRELGAVESEISQLKLALGELKLIASGKVPGEIEFSENLKKNLLVHFDFNTRPAEGMLKARVPEDSTALVEGAEWIEKGKHGAAMRFDGVDDRLRLSASLPDSDELTVSVWIFYEAKTELNGAIFSDFDGRSGNDVMFSLLGGKKIFVRADKGKGNSLLETIEVEDDFSGGWHHFVWTIDSSRSIIYVDGKRVGSVSKPGSNNGSHDTFIGYGHNGKGWDYLEGMMDELAIWSVDLSASEVSKLYQLSK